MARAVRHDQWRPAEPARDLSLRAVTSWTTFSAIHDDTATQFALRLDACLLAGLRSPEAGHGHLLHRRHATANQGPADGRGDVPHWSVLRGSRCDLSCQTGWSGLVQFCFTVRLLWSTMPDRPYEHRLDPRVRRYMHARFLRRKRRTATESSRGQRTQLGEDRGLGLAVEELSCAAIVEVAGVAWGSSYDHVSGLPS